MEGDHDRSAADEQKGHGGHQPLAYRPDPADSPQHDDSRQGRCHQPDRQLVSAKGVVQRGGDGVGLYQIASGQSLSHADDGKQRCQPLLSQTVSYIAHGPAPPAAGGSFSR